MLDNTAIIDETDYTGTITFQACPISESIAISNGRYSGTGTGSYSGTESGSYSGTGTGSYSGSESGSYSGSSASTSGSLSVTLTGTGGSQNISGNNGSTSGSVGSTGYMSIYGSTFSGSCGTQTLSLAGTATTNTSTGGYLNMSESGSTSSSESGTTSSNDSGSVSSSASGSTSSTDSGTFTLSVSNTGHCVMHYHIPVDFYVPLADGVTIKPNDYYGLYSYISLGSVSTSRGTVKNLVLSADTGSTVVKLGSNRGPVFMLGSQLLGFSSPPTVGCILYLDFDYGLDNFDSVVNVTMNFTITPRLRHVKDSMQSVVGSDISSDVIQHQLTEESNEIANDTNTTTHSIFDSISDFFGSFFSNLIGVFVPESGYFSQWFTRVNNLLTDKLGILYYPFGYFINLLTDINSTLSNDTGNNATITFPRIAFTNLATNEEYVFLESQEVNLARYITPIPTSPNSSVAGTSTFANTRGACRNLSSIIIAFALLQMFVRKLHLIMRGSENG